MTACWHRRWGLSCDASRDDIRTVVQTTLEQLKQDQTGNAERIQQICADYQKYRQGTHGPCVLCVPQPVQDTLCHKRPFPHVDNAECDTDARFAEVDFSEGIPAFALEKRGASFYNSSHTQHPATFPLSSVCFSTRRDVYDHGLTNFPNGEWKYHPMRSAWLARDSMTNQQFVCALVVNEVYEPRFGLFLCPDPDCPDLTVRPVPCFIKRRGYQELLYCGTWSFHLQREEEQPFVYVNDTRARKTVYRTTLASYDNHWGEAHKQEVETIPETRPVKTNKGSSLEENTNIVGKAICEKAILLPTFKNGKQYGEGTINAYWKSAQRLLKGRIHGVTIDPNEVNPFRIVQHALEHDQKALKDAGSKGDLISGIRFVSKLSNQFAFDAE